MKNRTKNMIRRVMKTALSISLAFVIALGLMVTPATMVSAQTPYIEEISVDQQWRGSWTSAEMGKVFNLEVDQTGFYTLSARDYKQTGTFVCVVTDESVEGMLGFVYEELGNDTFTSSLMFLVKGTQYLVALVNMDEENFSYLDAEVEIKFTKSSSLPDEISDATEVQLGIYPKWLRFTPSQSGDYTLTFTEMKASISVCDAVTGEDITEAVTVYYDDQSGEILTKDRMVVNLKANREYYFGILNASEQVTNVTFSISKNDKTISTVELVVPDKIDSRDDSMILGASAFDYKVEYTDFTWQVISYKQLCEAGIEVPEVEYLGDWNYINGEIVLASGIQPISVAHSGGEGSYEGTVYVEVESIVDALISDGATAKTEGDNIKAVNQAGEYFDYSRVKINKTAVYNFHSAEWDKAAYVSAAFIDSKNNEVVYNEAAGGYPLVAGQEYALSFYCEFNSSTDSYMNFTFRTKTDNIFPDTNAGDWYHDAVMYSAGRGILKGYDNGYFGTADGIQRQDFLVMLARFDGVDLDFYMPEPGLFTDVAEGSYYEAAVAWGYENGIVNGYENGAFGVGDMITREQIVTFLYRYADYKELPMDYLESTKQRVKEKYSDFANVSDFAVDAVVWAIENGVISGKENNTAIDPQGNAQRCEVAQIMYNIFKKDIL